MKRRRELHAYKDSPVKTTILVPVYVRVVPSPFLVCSNNNKQLDTVISSSVFKNVHRNKSSVYIKIILFSCPGIEFNNNILYADVNNNIFIKLEERQHVERCKYDALSSFSSSENTSNKDSRISGSRNKSKCERMTEIIMNYGSPNSRLDILRQVMKGSLLSTTLELITSRSSESSEQYSSALADLKKIVKYNTSKKSNTRRQLLREGKVNL